MEILKILEESGQNLYLEDLDFFETELATGGCYSEAYQSQCMKKIRELRTWMAETQGFSGQHMSAVGDDLSRLMVSAENIVPNNADAPTAPMKPEEQIFHDIKIIREDSSYKTSFKKYVLENSKINTSFVDRYYSFFEPWEIDAIVSVRQMGEAFLEKYFDAIDHDKIARYQVFSEAFFMKHFAQLDTSVVLEHGENEWRKKGLRSKQLDVFLRLKGVKI